MAQTPSVRFSLLGGGSALGDDQLHDLYSYPETGECVVRGNAIASLDGAATTAGVSGGLGGPGDRRLFAVLREAADVIVVGAGTARQEKYRGARMTADQRRRRQDRGQAEVPPIAVVTRSGVIEHDLAVLTDTEVAPLILTCSDAADGARSRLGKTAEVIDCSGADPGEVDLAVLRDRLAGRGLMRVLTEGGPSLLGSFIAAGLLDELCLTTAPLVAGGAAVRIAAGGVEVLAAMRRSHVLSDDDGYLYARYVRTR